MRYFERRQPLARIGDLVHEHAVSRGFTALDIQGKPKPIITNEGEYGAIVQTFGVRGGRSWSCSFGFVFCDDWYSSLDATSSVENAAHANALVTQILATEEHHLGVRRRRFLHRPPKWQSLGLGASIAHYFHEEYPLVDVRLSVFPAVPLRRGRRPILDLQRVLGEHVLVEHPVANSGFRFALEPREQPFVSDSGLQGTWWQCSGTWGAGGTVMRDVIVLYDNLYAYAIESAAPPQHHAEVTDELKLLALSVQPIPQPGDVVDVSSVSHWAD